MFILIRKQNHRSSDVLQVTLGQYVFKLNVCQQKYHRQTGMSIV